MTLIKQHTNGSNWQLLFDDLPTGVVIIDGQGIVEACNKAAKDFLGEELTVGDWIAFASFEYTNLQSGKITKINEKTVSIKPHNGKKTLTKSSSQITKLSKERAVLLSLEM